MEQLITKFRLVRENRFNGNESNNKCNETTESSNMSGQLKSLNFAQNPVNFDRTFTTAFMSQRNR